MSRTLSQHFDPEVGPKRILSLDGGGIRGALTLGYLQKLESILREKEGNPKLLLCDYFDLIGGTSTGSIIAAGLAIGKTVEEMRELYMELGGKIFGKKHSFWKPWETAKYLKAGYDHKALEQNLKKVLGDITMGSDKIKTGLCIVAKRADTNSTWPLINHPDGRYFDSNVGRNKDIPLWKAVRASSAAPTYFAPQMIDVGNNMTAAFVDGGVSMANNPSLSMLMVATLNGFPFKWKMGEENLSVVSIGTGYSVFEKKTGEIEDFWLKTWAEQVPNMLMQDASWQNQAVLQWLSDSPTSVEIDGEMGDLRKDSIGGKSHLRYLRYNFPITQGTLNDLRLGREFSLEDAADVVEMSNAENRFLLYDIGKAASESIRPEHFD